MIRNSQIGSASWAFAALILFITIVYANPGNWWSAEESLPFAKIAAALAITALAGSWLLYRRHLHGGGAVGVLLVLLSGLVGASSAWSFWPSLTFNAFLDGIKYLAIFFVIVNVIDSRARLARIIRVAAWVSLIPAIGCLISYSRGEHLVEGDRAAWIGIFANPNDLAYHLVVGIALTLAAKESAHSRGARALYLALLIPMGLALLLTQSRGGMISAGAVLALWTARSLRHAPALIGVAIALGCVLFLSPRNPWTARERSVIAYGEDASAEGRVDAWRTGLNMAAERPLSGVGAGAFMVAWPSFAPGDVGPARTEHNTFIQLLSELGIGGLLLFLSALLIAAFGLSRAARDPLLKIYARGIQCGLAGFAMCSVTGGIAFTWPIYLLFGFAVATSAIAIHEQRASLAART